MSAGMDQILAAIQAGASGDELAALPIPESFRAAFVRRDETEMFEGVPSDDKDPTKSIHVDDVPTPTIAPDEVYIAVMASCRLLFWSPALPNPADAISSRRCCPLASRKPHHCAKYSPIC
jgi:hypothetical protein